ncbi:iron-sulfur cluster assembly scaffold protein [Govanella unica]|uniref:Iron-sulfur cluster assembly scaffold protein n=1 Tax=Govanella unica TaxID=2975056 RepID=A0A9X3TYD7_9PROT|nr:iron-sulfur cluster assembly scaffold protein [Govania unica]MDA5193657.1 iron-sulfur cluster assembly scaffold protein [Govania unica]
MIDPLYQTEILRLAATAHGAGRLEAPDASADIRNPLCGDRITLDLRIKNGVITEVGHKTRACVLCQASASLLAETLPGLEPAACHATEEAIRAFLSGGPETALPAAFTRFSVFAPVQPHAARQKCVLLPFEALTTALKTPVT